jgi:hypothetical protein
LEHGFVWQPWRGERPEKLKAKSRCNQGEIWGDEVPTQNERETKGIKNKLK